MMGQVAEKRIFAQVGLVAEQYRPLRPCSSTIIRSGLITTTTLVTNAQIHMIISAAARLGSAKTISHAEDMQFVPRRGVWPKH